MKLEMVLGKSGYEVHDFITDHGRFICGSYDVLDVDIKNFVKKLLRKRTLIIAKSHTLKP